MSFKTVSKAEYTRIAQKDSPSKKLDGLSFVRITGGAI